MNRIRIRSFMFLAAAWMFAAPANAVIVSQQIGFTFLSVDRPMTLNVNPFDTSLGRLDEVRVSIDGNVAHIGAVTGVIPYEVTLNIDLFGQLMSFQNAELSLTHSGIAPWINCTLGCVPGVGSLILTATIDLDFRFDRLYQEITGLEQGHITGFDVEGEGLTGVVAPFLFNGAISAFEEPLIAANQLNLVMARHITGSVLSLSSLFTGSLSLAYDYTPNPVPIPAATWLFATALMGLTGLARRKTPA